jgi:hypothetical protein
MKLKLVLKIYEHQMKLQIQMDMVHLQLKFVELIQQIFQIHHIISRYRQKYQTLVETFLNVNLDPDSPRYIARVIGDRYQTVTDANEID